jgi:hypothetical protein
MTAPDASTPYPIRDDLSAAASADFRVALDLDRFAAAERT